MLRWMEFSGAGAYMYAIWFHMITLLLLEWDAYVRLCERVRICIRVIFVART